MHFAMPPAVSAITAIVIDVDQHERSSCGEEIVDMADLRQVWAQIPDPRDRRGRRHPLVVMLALVQAAIVSGAVSLRGDQTLDRPRTPRGPRTSRGPARSADR
ncbi:transposase family protein [Microbispora sp. NBC_01189]|uniref:transposase family protein n=1 Tax=Microbispora sp. NBC_01189 TaxID=2903583 RepID=UPI002E1158B0|nr:transposase family protein [Microbispora sp. NBC_01189]